MEGANIDVKREPKVNGVMLRRGLPVPVEEEWVALRRELNVLASVYYLTGYRFSITTTT